MKRPTDGYITPAEREQFIVNYVAEGMTRDEATRAERLIYNAYRCPDEARGWKMYNRALDYLYARLPARPALRRAS
jgi:hypothetical protein